MDNNNKQTFRVYYYDGSNNFTSFDFTYVKVQSLLTPMSCSQIVPNQSSITAPPCQTGNHTISFNTVQFGNPWESPAICYGSITDYEYLLPVGWSLNGSTSTGSNWITGSNNVTVTSDMSHGGNVRIRPKNTCASGLYTNQEASIPVYRDKPALTFTGGYTVCTASPGQNFQANSVPSAFTNYNWVVTPSNIFGNSTPTSNPTTVTKLFDGEGDIQLTISNPGCLYSFVYNTQEITGKPKLVAGKPSVQSATALLLYDGPGTENEVCRDQETIFDFTTGTGSTTTWSYVTHNGNPIPSWTQYGSEDVLVHFFRSTQNTLVLKMDVTNTCGTTSNQFGFLEFDCSGMRQPRPNSFKISPNPASSTITINPVDKDKAELISEVFITDFNNNIVSRKSLGKVQSAQYYIGDLRPGTYNVTIVTSSNRETQKIIKHL